MTDEEQLRGSRADRAVEDGATYRHAEHGHVEVTGIWHRTRRLDAVSETSERELVVVRFVPADGGEWIDELAERLEEFLVAVE